MRDKKLLAGLLVKVVRIMTIVVLTVIAGCLLFLVFKSGGVADAFMLLFTFVIALSTYLLWRQTKRSHELTLFLHFLEFIKEAKGLGGEPGEKIRQHIMDQIYHPKPIFEVLDKAFPEYSKKFKKIFKLDKEALKIVDFGFYSKK